MLSVLDVIQMMPAHLAVDTAGCKPKQPCGLRLIALFSAQRGFQQNPSRNSAAFAQDSTHECPTG